MNGDNQFNYSYAREIGPKIQAFLEDYFAVPFPLPKQVNIGIILLIY